MYLTEILIFCLCCYFVDAGAYSTYEGDSCNLNGQIGSCRLLDHCQSALFDLKNRRRPQICSFADHKPIVCCLDSAASITFPTTRPVVNAPKRPSWTTEYIHTPKISTMINKGGAGDCRPIAPNLTAPKNGRKAWDKCLEYQEKFVYPCGKSAALSLGKTRLNQCHHNTHKLVVGGEDAAMWEYPHMVLLGFGDSPDNWDCGGSIISDRFILTAGHCTYSTLHHSIVTYARIGALRKSSALEADQVYTISRIVKHPDYKSPIKYNDIALLQTEIPMLLNQYRVPACLDVREGVVDDEATATGWGFTKFKGQPSEVLQKVHLRKFSSQDCSWFFRPGDRNFRAGYQAASQMCYGYKNEAKDTCQGDSGGPLQVKNRKIICMYTVVGITSFGNGCGNVGVPAIYTRVSNYVDWIESVVWP